MRLSLIATSLLVGLTSTVPHPSARAPHDRPAHAPRAPVARQAAPPDACSDSTHRAFDFWVGSWRVMARDTLQVGTNTIERLHNGCLLRENWRAADGSTGTSINYYDPHDKVWKQLWTDDGGTIVDVEGTVRDGAMHFAGTHRYPDGRSQRYTMVFTPLDGGRVRQHIEESKDDGKTWIVTFDAVYVPGD